MATPILDPRGYNPFGQDPAFGQVIDRGRSFGQVIDRGPAFGQVIDRGRALDQGPVPYVFGQPGTPLAPQPDSRAGVVPGPNIAANPNGYPGGPGGGGLPGDPGGHPGGTNPNAPPAVPPPPVDPFADWYKNTIQAHPEKYDTGISEAQWKAWFPLWTGNGFKSSKVDQNGNPIQGVFDKPDDCPPGMAAFGQNQCRPAGASGGGGGGAGGGGGTGGGLAGGASLNTYPTINWPTMPTFTPPTGATEINDPGYQFRLDQGQAALAASAAARGTLNSGGTLLGAQKFGQDYASSEFDKVFQRAKDEYAPKLAQWQIQAQAAKEEASAVYQRMWDQYTFGNLSAAQKAQLQAQMAALQAQIDAMILNSTAP